MTVLTILIVLAMSPWQSLNAEVLVVDGIDASNGRAVRGLSKQSVRAKWGDPQTTRGAVGEPPISRWEYSNQIVYFEYDRVIHAVRKR